MKIEAHSPEWYKARLGLFTASRLHDLICTPKDKSDFRPYIYEKAAEIQTGTPQDSDYVSDDMAHGVEYEPFAINWYSKLTGNKVEELSEFIKVDGMRFGATVDRNAYDKNGAKVVMEVKCPASKTHLKYCLIKDVEQFKKKLPKYYWQCVGGALAVGAKKAVFVSHDPRVNLDCGLFVLHFDIPEYDFDTAKSAIIKAEKDLEEILSLLKPQSPTPVKQ